MQKKTAGEGSRSPERQNRNGVGLRKQVPEGSIANIHRAMTLRQYPTTCSAACDEQGGGQGDEQGGRRKGKGLWSRKWKAAGAWWGSAGERMEE